MHAKDFERGALVTVRGHDGGSLFLHALLPKGAHGKTCRLVELRHFTDDHLKVEPATGMYFLRTVRISDVSKVKKHTSHG